MDGLIAGCVLVAVWAFALAAAGLVAERKPRWCDRMADAVFGESDEEQIP